MRITSNNPSCRCSLLLMDTTQFVDKYFVEPNDHSEGHITQNPVSFYNTFYNTFYFSFTLSKGKYLDNFVEIVTFNSSLSHKLAFLTSS